MSDRPGRVDAHQHYWRVARGDYPWMPADGPLRRDYLPADLRAHNDRAGIDATIAVQAAPTVAETDWLLDLARDGDSRILGVVGWAPLDDPRDETIERLAADPLCVGVRPMLQDLPEDDWIARRVSARELERIAAGGLVLELLTYPRQLAAALEAVARVAELTVVVDHLSKPAYREPCGEWAELMRAIADRPRTYCKLSGMVTEVGRGWSADDFRRHADHVLDVFGSDRVIFGTDWPVCLTAASHAEVVALAERLLGGLGDEDRAAVFGGNARRVYDV